MSPFADWIFYVVDIRISDHRVIFRTPIPGPDVLGSMIGQIRDVADEAGRGVGVGTLAACR